mmetsp:Transcript_42417/g.133842  ORF Transcript_42417/g.133842 Transcript_42417/m.133842 type:complete len:375 (-) Transcript_42417:120-1244(-)
MLDAPPQEPLLATCKGCVLLSDHALKLRAFRIVAALVGANACILTLLFVIARTYPSLLSAGLLALSFGLRHAVDADHIAAIDNVTRRLIADRKQPQLTGLWFSLGHSSVVGMICVATACGAGYLKHSGVFEGVGAVVSTAVSASVLFLIGFVNLLSLLAAHRSSASAGHTHSTSFIERCFPKLLEAIDSPAKMAGLGFLFGLGFETSSEVALLALSAMSPAQGIPPACTLVLPLLFAGGMSLIDTLDGLAMSYAYRAAARAGSRATFNTYLTAASSLIAVAIGTIELLGLAQREWDIRGGVFWHLIATLNANFEIMGYSIMAFFCVSVLAAGVAWTCPMRGCVVPPPDLAAEDSSGLSSAGFHAHAGGAEDVRA